MTRRIPTPKPCIAHSAASRDYTCRTCKTRVPAIPRATAPLTAERKAELDSLFA